MSLPCDHLRACINCDIDVIKAAAATKALIIWLNKFSFFFCFLPNGLPPSFLII